MMIIDRLYSNPQLINRLTLFLGVVILSLLAGFITSSGNVILTVIFAGVVIAGGLISQPLLLLWSTTVFVLLIAGSVKFLFGFDRIWWIAYGMALLLFVPAVTSLFNSTSNKISGILDTRYPLFFLVFLVIVSSMLAKSPVAQIVVATKSLVMFGGVWALLATIDFSKQTICKWLLGLLAIALFQLLPALYQYLFVRATRQQSGLDTVAAADSVVGTFGGSMESGGLTGVLAFYLLLTWLAVVAMYRFGIIPRKKLWIIIPIIISPLALVEVKAIFVLIPVGFMIIFKDVIIKRPAKALVGMTVSVLFLFALLFLYQTFHWSSGGMSFTDSITQTFSYSFKEEAGFHSSQEGRITRKYAYTLWIDNHSLDNIKELMIGHGLGSSRTQGAYIGAVAAAYYPLTIDRVGWVMFLWDFGIIGVALTFTIFIFALINAGRAASDIRLPNWMRAIACALQAFIPLIMLSMAYRNDIPYAAPMMFIVMATLGLISWLNKQRSELKLNDV